MKNKTRNNRIAYTILSAIAIVIGLFLLVYMITVEDEPGAVPVLLILAGLVLLVVIYFKNKKQTL